MVFRTDPFRSPKWHPHRRSSISWPGVCFSTGQLLNSPIEWLSVGCLAFAGSIGASMVIESSSSFLEVLEKSGLLSAEQFSIAHDGAQQTDDPKALAWKLIHQELLTRWQAEQLLRGSVVRLGKVQAD